MSMRTKSVFDKKSIFDKKPKTKINFDKGLKSIDHEPLSFINFFSSKECAEYQLISKYYEKANSDDLKFLSKEFSTREYTTYNENKNNRLRVLIKETTGETLSDIELLDITKYRHNDKKGIQLFIRNNAELDIGEVYLIDLYHMVLPTEDKRFNQRKSNPLNHYNNRKSKVKHNVNLQAIKYHTK